MLDSFILFLMNGGGIILIFGAILFIITSGVLLNLYRIKDEKNISALCDSDERSEPSLNIHKMNDNEKNDNIPVLKQFSLPLGTRKRIEWLRNKCKTCQHLNDQEFIEYLLVHHILHCNDFPDLSKSYQKIKQIPLPAKKYLNDLISNPTN